MYLFNNKISNLLPYDGIVNYYGKIMDSDECKNYYNNLLKSIIWKNDETYLFGKHIITKRKVAWYGDLNYLYTYSNTTKQALEWQPTLLLLKNLVEEILKIKFNSCLLNLYHNGSEGMSWHSDDEKELGYNPNIASISLGAERNFYFKHKETKHKIPLLLENGSLLVMKDVAQTYWLHSLPKSKKITESRINLTFRTIMN